MRPLTEPLGGGLVGAALKVLIFSKSSDGSEALLGGLGGGGFDTEWEWINNRDAMMKALDSKSWDLMLSDDSLSNFDSIKTLAALADAGPALPYIVVSPGIDMDRAVELMKAGCADIIRHNDAGRLVSVVERELQIAKNNRLKRRDEEKIRHQANYDVLTDLPNRALFFDRLSQALKQARREESRLALQFIDLDNFKHVNDSMGHASGDLVLQQAARRLESCIRESDTVARFGGDEFAIILSKTDTTESARIVADKILDSFTRPFSLDAQTARTTVSIGTAFYPSDGDNAKTLLTSADMAMYQAKKRGRDMVCNFHPRMLPRKTEETKTSAGKQPDASRYGWLRHGQGFFGYLNDIFAPRRAMLALAGLAAAGWLVVAALVLTPNQHAKSVITIEENGDLGNFVPASGPDENSTPETVKTTPATSLR